MFKLKLMQSFFEARNQENSKRIGKYFFCKNYEINTKKTFLDKYEENIQILKRVYIIKNVQLQHKCIYKKSEK